MTTYTYLETDMLKGAPRVLPAPLVAGAIFLSGVYEEYTDELEDFLELCGIDLAEPRHVWMTFVWDTTKGKEAVAQAAFSWIGDHVVLEGMFVDPEYQPLNLDSFLVGMGSALFGSKPVKSSTEMMNYRLGVNAPEAT